MTDYSLGCRLPAHEWALLNRTAVFSDTDLMRYVSAFPPPELMQNTTGLYSNSDFASHGADFWMALSEASPKPLSQFASVLDFGCGCGRLARMFKGHPGHIAGCDIDGRHVDWCSASLDFMETKLSHVTPPIPFADRQFEAVISISIFTHLNEQGQDKFLAELARVCRPDGYLFLTVHGARALERAITEYSIRNMLDVPTDLFEQAQSDFSKGKYGFILQQGHLTTTGAADKPRDGKAISDPFEYGITFIPYEYIVSHWAKWFDLIDYRVGALHDFQDVVVLKPRRLAI